MIVIRVELWSAVNGSKTEIARAMIDNIGGTERVGNYAARTYRGRNERDLDRAMLADTVTRSGKVDGHRRLDLHVWHLVGKALAAMGYGQ